MKGISIKKASKEEAEKAKKELKEHLKKLNNSGSKE